MGHAAVLRERPLELGYPGPRLHQPERDGDARRLEQLIVDRNVRKRNAPASFHPGTLSTASAAESIW